MMKTIILVLFLCLFVNISYAQSPGTDSLRHELTISRPDENRVDILLQLSSQHANTRPDSATIFAEQALSLAREIDFLEGEARALGILSYINRILGDYPESFRQATKGLQIAKENNFIEGITLCLYGIGAVYSEGLNDHPKAIDYFKQAKEWQRSASGVWNNVEVSLLLNMDIATSYLRSNALDSAAVYFEKTLPDSNAFMYPIMLLFYGELQFELGNRQEALDYSLHAIQSLLTRDDHRSLADAYLYRALYFRDMEQTDSCLYYAQRSLSEAESISYQPFVLKAATLLAETYEANNDPEALRYYKMAKLANDDVYGEKKVQDLQRTITEELERQQEAEKATIAYRNRVRQNTLFGGMGVVLLIAFLLLRNNWQRRKANTVLESKNRELEIETALERVRARTMGMQHSNELADAASVLYQQLLSLGIKPIACAFVIFDEEKRSGQVWIATGGRFYPDSFEHPYHTEPTQERLFAAWKQNKSFHLEDLSGQALITHLTFIAQNMPVGEMLEAAGDAQPDRLAIHAAYFSKGFLGINYPHPQPDQIELLKRFAKVFDQTYTRFLDLQKAEAQAREAQVEAALERVRARAMAMHRSEEIPKVLDVVFEQLQQLSFSSYHTTIAIINPEETEFEFWSKGISQFSFPSLFVAPVIDHPYVHFWLNARKEGVEFNTLKGSGATKRIWDDYIFSLPEMQHMPEEVKKNFRDMEEAYFSMAYFKHGILYANGPTPLPNEQISTLKRFAKVFDLAYTRMLDLQKAEAQAREAQIEAALERVRSRAMAMHRSEEIPEVLNVVFEQIQQLGFSSYHTVLGIFNQDETSLEVWSKGLGAYRFPSLMVLPVTDHPHFNFWLNDRKKGIEFNSWKSSGKMLRDWDDFVFGLPEMQPIPEEVKNNYRQIKEAFFHNAYLQHGILGANGPAPLPDDQLSTLKRFAKVIDLTYTRMLDLQKAEAQAKEAQIEAALERVRSRTMAMRHSSELAEVVAVLFDQLRSLGGSQYACGLVLCEDNNPIDEQWMYVDGEILPPQYIPHEEEPVHFEMFKAWQAGAELFEETVEGDQNQAMTEFLMAQPSVRKNFEKLIERMPVISWQKLHAAYFSKGYLLIVSLEEEDSAVYTRFAKVFEQTYTRFLDLQEAELRAVEAARTASLDRVRGEIASMRSPDDLQRITPLVWRELTTLGVPFFRCGVFIMDEAGERVHAYLSTPEGKPLAVLHLPFDGAETTRQTVEHWRKGEVYTDFWDRQQFLAWVRSMTEQGLVSEAHTYQGGDEPPEALALQFVPFAQGMLYVGSHQPLPGDQVDLLRRLADTFAVAFARYEDFTKLEEAKSQIELTLTELKATQTQLIQSEKLASLGELTAGIAHEIQNPLNFVNNFAEVSAELIGEMKEEMQQGNTEDAVDIATDLEQNLAKIHHHGLRASSIVKSMLQHSRASTGEKEPTDLNALVDECVRLSYHGMRAQDRGFQAEYKLELAENLPAASVVPQDIGRVLLNLLNNAFYAVNEKRKTELVGTYHPLVQVSTHQSDGGVEIRIRDNGPGIPEAIREKIFQPFFTTKPTGQGTGLGLSLAYDIVTKGHGGMLEVESLEEGPVEASAQAGTVFLIEFPL